MLKLTKYCPVLKKDVEMELPITEEQFNNYLASGQLIQRFFPHLTAEQREFIISGISPEGWKLMFGGGEGE